MTYVLNQNSGMRLYSNPLCPYSHQVRYVLREKAVKADIVFVNINEHNEDLIELNPYGSMPTIVDRELVLYNARVIMEYLDERYPHPPLYPMDPSERAQLRLFMQRIDDDWYQLMNEIETSGEKKAARARKALRESLIASVPLFEANPFFMSAEFSLADCSLAPLLWRLPSLGIELSDQAEPITDYAQRIFYRAAFQSSLSPEERALREK